MKIQKTYKNPKPTIYLVGTPIGNLQDMSFRSIEVLTSVDEIYCEDTRTSSTLLSHYKIKKPLVSFHKFNEASRLEKIKESLEQGKNIAIISDAGVPVICDPGAKLLEKLINDDKFEHFSITAINAGPAYIHCLIVSGFSGIENNFLGFWDQKNKNQELVINNFKKDVAYIFYESVHRIRQTLLFLSQKLGGESKILIGREITKINEEFVWLSASEIQEYLDTNQLTEKGEFVVVLIPEMGNLKLSISEEEQIEKVMIEKNNGLNTKSAISKVSKEFGLNKNKLYELFHKK
ncbi:16S rRNA (cytidine(1402)-2'-O)-methyltransferase [Spiroplasma alleghenense]|uniref:16S rRNA (Cytidine1402-2'-O)-methyltransferase n=1 Tax=Spiroplasma alleghenense TaxID=216931 RepID=A0A345Z4D7_9MOLU|nr:16S rRNA (cytidine(1402)-2'-O)-methyltransferase [Spiroplasma alleghenense]AXK51466.1 16S rRNA (cytidine1402-2'-O)-methyltransferase [Spiroplasma alleghenense]